MTKEQMLNFIEKTGMVIDFARKYLMDCGGNAFTLQKLMGHSTLNMTKHYCRLFDNDVGKDYDLHSPLAQMQKTKSRISK